jgi:CHAT domain-containing protein
VTIRPPAITYFLLLTLAACAAGFAQSPTRLEPGRVFERELVKGSSHRFSLSLSAGECAVLSVEPQGTVVSVTFYGPNGQRIVKAAQPYYQPLPVHVPFVAETGGEYRIEVENDSTRLKGSCRIRLTPPKAPNAEEGRRAAAYRAYYDALRKSEETEDPAVYRRVIENCQALLPQWRAWGERQMESATLYTIAEGYEYQGQYDAALPIYLEAEALIRALDGQPGLAALLIRRGWVYESLGEQKQCEAVLSEALAIARSNGNHVHETRALEAMDMLYSHAGNRQGSIEIGLRLIQLRREIGDIKRESRDLNDLGVAFRRLGNQAQAAEYFRQALEKSRQANNTNIESLSLANLGQVAVTRGRLSEAEEHARQALAIAQRTQYRYGEAIAINVLGQVSLLTRQHETAADLFNQALALMRDLKDHDGQLKVLLNLGRTGRAMGRTADATGRLNEMLAIARRFHFPSEECFALYELALVERDLGKLESAMERIEAALDRVESLRARTPVRELREHFLSPVQEMYEFHIALLMARHRQSPDAGYAARALESSERARARSLIEMLAEARGEIRQGKDAALADRERELQWKLSAKAQRLITLTGKSAKREDIAALETELAALQEQARDLNLRIRAANSHYANLQLPQPLKLAEIQRQTLDERTLLLEYALGEERSWLWAVSPVGMTSHALPGRAEIEDLARRAVQLMRVKPRGDAEGDQARREYETAARRLSELILAPVADQLRDRRLLIVADGALRYVPFAALPIPASGGRTPGAPQAFTPLIIRHDVATIPSAGTLAVLRAELKDRKPATKTLAVLADPVFGLYDDRVPALARKGAAGVSPAPSPVPMDVTLADLERGVREDGKGLLLPRLPFTRDEADAITRFVPPSESVKSLGFQASRDAASSAAIADHRILHIATHGLLNSQHPVLSGLFLSMVDAGGQAQNGLLRVDEIYNLRLPVELVVLSACDSALGQEIKGEGIVGMTRGFMYAGAARVVASLWKVNDVSTSELMKRFYEGMLGERKLSPAAALRQAQVSMWNTKQWHAPYFWAAFVLQGEW